MAKPSKTVIMNYHDNANFTKQYLSLYLTLITMCKCTQ